MKRAFFACTPFIALILAGCAAEPAKVGDAEPCKVAPITVQSATGYSSRTKPASQLEQDYALMQLQSTPFYRNQLERRGYTNNTLADAVRDCY